MQNQHTLLSKPGEPTNPALQRCTAAQQPAVLACSQQQLPRLREPPRRPLQCRWGPRAVQMPHSTQRLCRAGATTRARFCPCLWSSGVQATGTLAGQWTTRDLGFAKQSPSEHSGSVAGYSFIYEKLHAESERHRGVSFSYLQISLL